MQQTPPCQTQITVRTSPPPPEKFSGTAPYRYLYQLIITFCNMPYIKVINYFWQLLSDIFYYLYMPFRNYFPYFNPPFLNRINASDESLLLHVVTVFDFVTLKGNIINKWYLINYLRLHLLKEMYTCTKIYVVPVQALYRSPVNRPYQVKRSFQTFSDCPGVSARPSHQQLKTCHSLPTF